VEEKEDGGEGEGDGVAVETGSRWRRGWEWIEEGGGGGMVIGPRVEEKREGEGGDRVRVRWGDCTGVAHDRAHVHVHTSRCYRLSSVLHYLSHVQVD
jgi:hypothetical protein